MTPKENREIIAKHFKEATLKCEADGVHPGYVIEFCKHVYDEWIERRLDKMKNI